LRQQEQKNKKNKNNHQQTAEFDAAFYNKFSNFHGQFVSSEQAAFNHFFCPSGYKITNNFVLPSGWPFVKKYKGQAVFLA
jgi:hypothetical protein